MLQIRQISKLENPHFLNVAFIPTGEAARLKNGNFAETAEDNYKSVQEFSNFKGLNIFIPEDDNISLIRWGYASTHSPKKRAELLYDAIFVKCIEVINITGGRGSDLTVIELDKLIKEKKPKLVKKVGVFGMSDATHLLNYLGQNGYATPYISKNEFSVGKPLNQKIDYAGKRLEGVMQPEYLVRSWGTIERTKLIKDKINFLAIEINFVGESEIMKNLYSNVDKDSVVFCLSVVGDRFSDSYYNLSPQEQLTLDLLLQNRYSGKLSDISINQQKVFEEIQKNPRLRRNNIKLQEQTKFKEWCIEKKFVVVEGLKFGHFINKDQYAPVPTYCKCVLDNRMLAIESQSCVNSDTDFIDIPLNFSKKDKPFSLLRFGENYVPGGNSDFSVFNEGYNLKPNNRGLVEVEFTSYDEKQKPYSVYIQDLEKVLKDIARLNVEDMKVLEINNFTLLEKNRKQFVDVVTYIVDSFEYFEDKEVKIGHIIFRSKGLAMNNY